MPLNVVIFHGDAPPPENLKILLIGEKGEAKQLSKSTLLVRSKMMPAKLHKEIRKKTNVPVTIFGYTFGGIWQGESENPELKAWIDEAMIDGAAPTILTVPRY